MAYKSYLNKPGLPRGIRNNNPGNLRRSANAWQGKIPYTQSADASFEQFIELRYGVRALMRDIISDFKGGSDTIRLLISEFAPPTENNTIAYINSVSQGMGIGPDAVINNLSQIQLKVLCKAIIKVENGAVYDSYVSDSDYNDALAILGLDLGGIVKKKKKK